jgi:hypothetical protein
MRERDRERACRRESGQKDIPITKVELMVCKIYQLSYEIEIFDYTIQNIEVDHHMYAAI